MLIPPLAPHRVQPAEWPTPPATVGWLERAHLQLKTGGDTERTARNAEAFKAASALMKQELPNLKAKPVAELRDYRTADVQQDLDKCERAMVRWSTAPPRPEAAK